MTENNYFEVNCTREVKQDAFPRGIQDYVFSIGAPNCWIPSKSYFRINMSIYETGTANLPLYPSDLSAFADNAAGNLFDNTYVRTGQQDISCIVQGSAQASALDVRLNNTYGWLQSMGNGSAVNESSFLKRLVQVSANPSIYVLPTGNSPQITSLNEQSNHEIYYPSVAATGAAAGNGRNPSQISLIAGSNTVTGTNGGGNQAATLFTTGMPTIINAISDGISTGFPQRTGGPILPGDLIVINGVSYEISSVTNATSLTLVSNVVTAIVNSSDWYIIRSDVIRSKQASSTTYAIWQPPIGLFKYDEELGAGEYRIQLNPNSNYQLTAAETRYNSPKLPYYIVVNSVKFYAFIEKKIIPDTIKELYLSDMMVQSKPYVANLQFSVPPSTTALTIFLQDSDAGQNAQIPPSMFKCLDYTDLSLQNIQVTYANITKPSTNWNSGYGVAVSAAAAFTNSGLNNLEQRYHDSYEESGMDLRSCGCESFYDWMQRGPFYHFSFDRAENNKATEVQINTTYTQNVDSKRLFIIAHFRKTVHITTSQGMVVNVATREV